jgi:hypothetical protein
MSPPVDLLKSPFRGDSNLLSSPSGHEHSIISPSQHGLKPRRLAASSSYLTEERRPHHASSISDIRNLSYEVGRELLPFEHSAMV